MFIYTVRCHYNVVNIIKNIHQRHPLWQAMGCLLWIQPLIGILPQFLQNVQCLVILDHVIMTLYCSMITCLENQFLILSTKFVKLTRLHQLLFVPPSNDRIIIVMKSHLHYWVIVKGRTSQERKHKNSILQNFFRESTGQQGPPTTKKKKKKPIIGNVSLP